MTTSDAYPPVAITLPWGKTTGDPTSVRVLIATPAGRVDTGDANSTTDTGALRSLRRA